MSFLNNANSATAAEGIMNNIVDPVMEMIVKAALFVVTLAVFYILTGIVLFAVKKLSNSSKAPFRKTNKFLGAVFGMVKDNKHRTRAIAFGGGEIEINSHRSAFTLVSNIQEEVHRFAITYHHNKHKKSAFSSSLLSIDGIGEAKAKALMKHFKTISKIKEASVEELQNCPSIHSKDAQNVFNFYHKM